MNSEAHARDGANKVLVLLGFGQQKDSLCLLCALQLLCFRPAGILIMEGGAKWGRMDGCPVYYCSDAGLLMNWRGYGINNHNSTYIYLYIHDIHEYIYIDI